MSANKSKFALISKISMGWSMSQSLPLDVRKAAENLQQMAANLEMSHKPKAEDIVTMTVILCSLCKKIEKLDCNEKPTIAALSHCHLLPIKSETLTK